MQLKSLRLFISVAETGSFVAAAQRLHTVQSNVTAHIKKLEEELGVQLVQRGGHTRLTSAGNALASYAKRMLAIHDEAVDVFVHGQRAGGQLRIGAMETTMALRLPPILAAYHAVHPEVDITLTAGPSAELIGLLQAGDVDGVFVAGQLDHRHYHSHKVFSESLVLVGPTPMHSMPSSEVLLSSTFLAFRQGCSYRQRTELLLASYGINAVRIFEFGTLDAMLGCVVAGMGYTVLPIAIVKAHQQRFDIHYLELSLPLANIDTYFVTTESGTWSPALSRFIDTLNETVPKVSPDK